MASAIPTSRPGSTRRACARSRAASASTIWPSCRRRPACRAGSRPGLPVTAERLRAGARGRAPDPATSSRRAPCAAGCCGTASRSSSTPTALARILERGRAPALRAAVDAAARRAMATTRPVRYEPYRMGSAFHRPGGPWLTSPSTSSGASGSASARRCCAPARRRSRSARRSRSRSARRAALLLTRLTPEAARRGWRRPSRRASTTTRARAPRSSAARCASPAGEPQVAVVTAGTSDLPVAREAIRTLAFYGVAAREIADVGVAGLWRILRHEEELRRYPVVIVVAGMEGALFSVVAGLVGGVVIAVPTSTGYGAARQGETALHAALASCAPGAGHGQHRQRLRRRQRRARACSRGHRRARRRRRPSRRSRRVASRAPARLTPALGAMPRAGRTRAVARAASTASCAEPARAPEEAWTWSSGSRSRSPRRSSRTCARRCRSTSRAGCPTPARPSRASPMRRRSRSLYVARAGRADRRARCRARTRPSSLYALVGGLAQITATALLLYSVLVPQLRGRHDLLQDRDGADRDLRHPDPGRPARPRRGGSRS